MHPLYQKAETLTGEVIDAAIEVQKHFGIGLLENIYKMSLAQEMRVRGHEASTEVEVPITYKGFTFEEKLRLDCFIDKCLIVECKSLDEDKINMPRHKAQLLSYMKLMDIPLGLVINFGDYRLGKRGIGRVILKGADDTCILAKSDSGVARAQTDGQRPPLNCLWRGRRSRIGFRQNCVCRRHLRT